MKRISFLIALASLMTFAFGLAQGATEIVLDSTITGLHTGDTVLAGSAVRWNFRWIYTPGDGSNVTGSQNAFEVYTYREAIPAGYTDNFSAITYDTFPWQWSDLYDITQGLVFNPFSIDGLGADTIGFGGAKMFGPGIVDGTDSLCWWIETTPTQDGDTLCIDSSWYPPEEWETWIWSSSGDLGNFQPGWDGPHCFHVYDPSTGVKEVEGPDFPTTYSLSQNYPNPFNPSTEIKFDIPVRSHVTLTVYNVLGQKVTTLVDKEMSPGSYVADWNSTSDNGKEVTSGVYFYKLEADDFIKTKKMLLLK